MNEDSSIRADNKEQLQVEETDDSCRLEFFEIVPLARDTDGSCTAECVSGDWSDEVKQENWAVVKQEPDDNSESSAMYPVKNDAVPAEVDETQNHIQPVFALPTHQLACCNKTGCVSGDWSSEVKQENFSVVKQEPDDDFESSAMCFVKIDAVFAEVDEKLSHMDPVVVLETLDLALLQKKYHIWINTGESSCKVKTEADSSDHTEHSHDDKPRPYLCAVKNSLNVHQQTGDNWYSCTQCEKRYLSRFTLWNHMNIHRGKYKCTECGRCCGCERDLAAHRRRHSGEKPFECSVCSKRFTTSHHLIRHSRIHSGDKPYKCRLCDKAFNRSGNLNVHKRIHTGEKPYKCSLCNISFYQSSHLQRHKRCVHSNTTDELKQDENV